MVRVAVAGGTGQVAREIVDALLETKKHEVTILTRSKPNPDNDVPGVAWQIVDYNDKQGLTEALRGIHTLLSFVQPLADPDQTAQKNLIDAAIAAGVKRFAPSEFGSKETVNMIWWSGKEKVREYLEKVNATEQGLEYTLFQPGLFLNYLAYPHKTSKYLDPLQTVFNFEHKRAIVVEGHEDTAMTFTTVHDLAAVVARAVGYEGRWPTTGGIRGNRLTVTQLLDIGAKVRRQPFAVEKVNIEDLEAGELKTSWGLEAKHKAVSEEQAAAMLKQVSIGILLSSVKGAWDSSDELNQMFPDFKFTSAEDFLTRVWNDKP